jgi:hypothetical protein
MQAGAGVLAMASGLVGVEKVSGSWCARSAPVFSVSPGVFASSVGGSTGREGRRTLKGSPLYAPRGSPTPWVSPHYFLPHPQAPFLPRNTRRSEENSLHPSLEGRG